MQYFDYVQNYIAQRFPEKEVRFSRFYHQPIDGGKIDPINRLKDGAVGYLIHAITLSNQIAHFGACAITINGENILNWEVLLGNTDSPMTTHNFFHYHEGSRMNIAISDSQAVGTIHYQYLTFGDKRKEK